MSNPMFRAILLLSVVGIATAACGGGSARPARSVNVPSVPASTLLDFVCPTARAVAAATKAEAIVSSPRGSEEYRASLGDVPGSTPVPKSTTDCRYVIDVGGANEGHLDVQFVLDEDGSWYTQTARYLAGRDPTVQPSPPLGKESIALNGGEIVADITEVLVYVGGYDLLIQDHTNSTSLNEIEALAANVLADNR